MNTLIYLYLALDILVLQAQPPPDDRVYDIYQKFKHALNLLVRYSIGTVCKAWRIFKIEKRKCNLKKACCTLTLLEIRFLYERKNAGVKLVKSSRGVLFQASMTKLSANAFQYFRIKLHLKCSTWFWIRFCILLTFPISMLGKENLECIASF